MELISLYYFTELAKDMHITQTAERLFITQQTLSNHVARLENYFGVPLLYRKPKLSLTTAGEFVLAFANVIQQEQTNLTDILSDIEQQERGVVRFGASTLRMNSCMPYILPKFTQRYPKVELRLTDTITSELVPLVEEGKLDFAVVLSGKAEPSLVEHHLMDDHVYLCVADSLLREHYGEEAETIKRAAAHGANVKDFAKLPFCMLNNRMGEMVRECFLEAQITPAPYITSTYTQLSATVCFQRLTASFIPQALLVESRCAIPDDVNIFPLMHHGEPMVQHLSLIRRKDRYLSHFFKFFLDLLFQYYAEVEHIHLDRVVQG
ncbi:MAG: LysR family transcriptional regulator [Oscillospiraceae bacterium]|nr:LysR family transcriptional regulator [Oscillospiraceae bacterium]